MEELQIDTYRRCRVGRYIVDGADFAWIASRLQTTPAQVEIDWRSCREELSRHLSMSDDNEPRLFDIAEIRDRSEQCIRLLLDWQRAALDNERVKSFASNLETHEDNIEAS